MIKFVRRFFYLKNFFFRKHAYIKYTDSLVFESLSVERKKEIIFLSRKKLIESAYYNTQFYRKYYDSMGFHPDMLVTEKDWEKVPVLEKKMIRQNTKDFLAKDVSLSKMNVATTGGSTGKPLKVYKDKSVPVEILGWRSLKWWGVHPGDNHGVVNRSVPKTLKQKIRNYILWWPTKRIFLDASSVTESSIAEFVSLISKRKIKFLVGYCGSLEKIADYILKNDLKINVLKLVWSTTSPLAKPVRLKMEKAFNCKIMDQYGSIEVFNIAVQKPNENCLTVNSDYVHVDIVDLNNNILNATGEMGDVLVSDLYSYNFPIIKYRLGDRSRILKIVETSDDGFIKLDFVRGRISDFVVFKDKSYLDGAYLTTIFDGYEDVIDSYQIYQNSEYKVFLSIVLVKGISQTNERLNYIIENFSKFVRMKTEFQVVFVDSISDDKGKRRFVISDVVNN